MIRLSFWRCILVACLSVCAPCQLSRSTIAAPAAYLDPAYFDEARNVLVCWGTNAMWEYDGTSWGMIPCAVFPSYPAVASAWDPTRGKLIAVDYFQATTWEWDGLIWLNVGAAPVQPVAAQLNSWNHLVTYHASRQRVMLFSDGGLWEWNGVAWTLLNQPNAPPTWLTTNTWYTYGDMAYDARWDKVVLFGRGLHNTGGTGGPTENSTFEWDAVNDWVQLATLPGPLVGAAMWYDQHRGTVIRGYTYGGAPYGFYYRDSARNWVLLQSTSLFLRPGCLDARRNRYYSIDSTTTIGMIHDTHPAVFEPHTHGCTPATPWPLQLSAPWTRAWIGQSLSVDVTAPYSLAFMAMGFSDQWYGATPLPIDLGPYGIPGCSLNVAPDAVALGVDPSGRVTFSVPIPNAPGLLGVVFWQQSLALSVGTNAANLLATDSMRGTVGRFQ